MERLHMCITGELFEDGSIAFQINGSVRGFSEEGEGPENAAALNDAPFNTVQSMEYTADSAVRDVAEMVTGVPFRFGSENVNGSFAQGYNVPEDMIPEDMKPRADDSIRIPRVGLQSLVQWLARGGTFE